MLTNNDLQKIGQLVNDSELRVKEELKQSIAESEHRMVKRIAESEQNIIADVGKFIKDSILTQLDEKADKKDVKRLADRVTKLEQAEHIV